MLPDGIAAPPPIPGPRPIAPWSHTVAICAFFAFTGLLGHLRAAEAVQPMGQMLRYTSIVLYEWLLLGATVAGIYHRREFFVAAFGNGTRSIAMSLRFGMAIYLLGFLTLAVAGVVLYLTPVANLHNTGVVRAMMPHTWPGLFPWFLASLSAGVCEELIFRGYLLQQFTAWTRSPVAAIVVTGALFGCIHLYEGVAAIFPLAALGILYGLSVHRFKGDLRPAMVAHTLQDFLIGVMFLAHPGSGR